MRLGFELYSSLRYLRYHLGRTCLLISAVTVGTAALVIALSLMTGFQEDVRERIIGGSAHLTVLSPTRTFDEAESLAADVERVPGVQAAGPVLFSPAMLIAQDASAPAYAEIQGVDPRLHGRVVQRKGREGDIFAALAGSTGSGRAPIVLGQGLAGNLGVFPGDTVRLLVPSITLTPVGPIPRSRVFEVVDTYSSDYFQEDEQRAYIPLSAARRVLRAESSEASWVEVRLDDLRNMESMKTSLAEHLGPSWWVLDLIEQNSELFKALNFERLMLFLAIGLIVVVSGMAILLTLLLMVSGKVKEIGILSAMGARPRSIAGVFMLQGLVIGLLGTVLGLTLGAAVTISLDQFHLIKLNPDVYYLSYVPFETRVADLARVAMLALLVSALATVYPAWKAARFEPVEALRYE